MILIRRYNDLLTNSNGYSVKSWAVFWTNVLCFLLYAAVAFCLVWDVTSNGQIRTDLDRLGFFILSIAAVQAGTGVIKIMGDKANDRNNVQSQG